MNKTPALLLLIALALSGCQSLAPVTQQTASQPGRSPSPAVATPYVTEPPASPPQPAPVVSTAPDQTSTALPAASATAASPLSAASIDLDVVSQDDQPGFVVTCVDNQVTYCEYLYNDPQLLLYLSFDMDAINTATVEALAERFSYINFEVHFPELTTPTSRFYYGNRRPLEKLGVPGEDGAVFELLGYDQQRMQGRLRGTVTRITEFRTSNEPGCYVDDMGGICYREQPAAVPFTVTFDLSIHRQ